MNASGSSSESSGRTGYLAKRALSALYWLQSSETVVGFLLAVLVGVVAGLGAVAFRWLIQTFEALFFGGGAEVLGFLGPYYVILVPAVGGLLVGPMIYFLAREAKGHGVPEVMEAVALKGGRIRPRVAIIKSLASALCIGSGGSVGREGPIVQIGSSAGSAVGQWLKLPDETVKTLVACGAAGGIAATFNAPIAGVLFALEVILGRVVTRRFGHVVISAVVADFLARTFLGDVRAFTVPEFGLVSPWEFLFYAMLGILAGFTALAFTRVLYGTESLLEAVKLPEYLKPALGGISIGLIGLYSPNLFGVGYGGIEAALAGELTLVALGAFFVLKAAATSLTIGSGGSGGVFAPSLFIGAMMGAALGGVFGDLFPDITAPVGAYGIVGMAAVFAGAARAPFTAILIIFEMTGDYAIMLPVMTAVVLSTALSRALSRENIYTLKLLRRGVDLGQEEVSDIMRTVRVEEVMTRRFATIRAAASIDELLRLVRRTNHHGFPVVDDKGRLSGIVTLTDLERHLAEGRNNLTVGDIATRSPYLAYPDQSLDRVLRGAEDEYGRIPVVSRDDHRKLVGVLQRRDVIKAYRRRTRTPRGQDTAGRR